MIRDTNPRVKRSSSSPADSNGELSEQLKQLANLVISQSEQIANLQRQQAILTPLPETSQRPKRTSTTITFNSSKKKHDLAAVDCSRGEVYSKALHQHVRLCMGRVTATAPIPLPPSAIEQQLMEQAYPSDDDLPGDSAPRDISFQVAIQASSVVSDGFFHHVVATAQRWRISRITFNFEGNWDDRYNQVIVQFLVRTFKEGLLSRQYGVHILRGPRDDLILHALLFRHYDTLKKYYRAEKANPQALVKRKESNTRNKSAIRTMEGYYEWVVGNRCAPAIVRMFDPQADSNIMADENAVSNGVVVVRRCLPPFWWSTEALQFFRALEQRVHMSHLINTVGRQGSPRQQRVYEDSRGQPKGIPHQLPRDMYDPECLRLLSPLDRTTLNPGVPIFTTSMEEIFEPTERYSLRDYMFDWGGVVEPGANDEVQEEYGSDSGMRSLEGDGLFVKREEDSDDDVGLVRVKMEEDE